MNPCPFGVRRVRRRVRMSRRGLVGKVAGAVGRELTVDEGYRAARLTGLSILASLKWALGDLERVTRWLRAVGYVQSAPGFHDNAKVVNGFSDLIVEIWGDAGRHAQHPAKAHRRSTCRSSSTRSSPS